MIADKESWSAFIFYGHTAISLRLYGGVQSVQFYVYADLTEILYNLGNIKMEKEMKLALYDIETMQIGPNIGSICISLFSDLRRYIL